MYNRHPVPAYRGPAAEPPENRGVRITGLPKFANTQYVQDLIEKSNLIQSVARSKEGNLWITIFPLKERKEYKDARVTFTRIDCARQFKDRWDQECPPFSNHKMTVQFWEDKEKKNDFSIGRVPTSLISPNSTLGQPPFLRQTRSSSSSSRNYNNEPAESNGLHIMGLPAHADENFVIERMVSNLEWIAKGKNGKRLITVYDLKAGQSFKSSRITFTSIELARSYRNLWNGQAVPGTTNTLTIRFWEDKEKKNDSSTGPAPIPFISPSSTLGQSPVPRQTRSPSSSSRNSNNEPVESNGLRIMGLPTHADENFVIERMVSNLEWIAKGKNGKRLITVFDLKPGQSFKNCRITFTSIELARSYRNEWNGKAVPGTTNTLTIRFWEDRKENNTATPKEPIRPNRSIIIRGLPVNITVAELCFFIGNVASGKSHEPLVSIFSEEDGYKSASAILPSVAEATDFIKKNNGKPLAGYPSNNLKINYFINKNGPKVDNDTALKIRQATAAKSESVIIKGLFNTCDEEYLLTIVGHGNVQMGKNGKRMISMFSAHNSAKITFTSVAQAEAFVKKYNKNTLPNQTNMLTVQFYLDLREQKDVSDPIVIKNGSDNQKTIVRNVLYAQGIDKSVIDTGLYEIIEKYFGQRPHKVNIYKYENGKSQGRGTISFKEASDAERCLKHFEGAVFANSNVPLTLTRFETSKINRLASAIGNEERWETETGAAYDCLGCFEIWDERDMIGCVPIDREAAAQTHFLCQECVRNCSEANKVAGKLGSYGTGFECPEIGCKRVLLWATVQRVLTNKETAARLDGRMTKEALREIEGIEYCKEEGCDFGAFLDDSPRIMQFFSCQNPACLSQFCRMCKVSFGEHVGRSCDDVDPRRQAERRERIAADERNEILSRSKMLICPKCGRRFTKDEDGSCNKMTCDECGFTMCYVCKAHDITYDHFGGACKLFESAIEIDRRNLERAQREIDLQPQLAQTSAEVPPHHERPYALG